MSLSKIEEELKQLKKQYNFHLSKTNEYATKINDLEKKLKNQRLSILDFKVGDEIQITDDIQLGNKVFYKKPKLLVTSITEKFFYLKVESGDVYIKKIKGYDELKKVQLSKGDFSTLIDYSDMKTFLNREDGLNNLID
jgi:hypothetical protein